MPFVVEALVADQRTDGEAMEQRLRADTVMTLSRQEDATCKVAQRIDQRHDLGRPPAAGASDGLILSPPFAPVPCWWTRMMVPSIRAYSKSGSPDKASKSRLKTPFKAHRRKRLNVEFQFPKISGRSRQGPPTRAIHKTASRNRRLSAPDRPGSPTLPGRCGAARSHCSSLKIRRFKASSILEP